MDVLKLRGWILLMAATTFTAGVAIGRWTAGAGEPEPAPFEAYASRLESEFQLSPRRAAHLRWLLADHARELETIEAAFKNDARSAMRAQLAERDEQFAALIRDKVLPPRAHARYDEMLAAGFTHATPR